METLNISEVENNSNHVQIQIPSTNFSDHAEKQELPLDETQNHCLICWENNVKELFKPLACRHSFCQACLEEYLKSQLNFSKVLHIQCPSSQCRESFSIDILKQYLNKENFTLYENLVLNKVQNKEHQIKVCPKSGCSRQIKLTLKTQYTQCKCGTKVCNLCLNFWHPGKTCLEVVDPEFENYAKEEGVKFCIVCKTQVLRVEGCKHITCPICDFEWCWDCGRQFQPEHEIHCPKIWSPVPPSRPPIAQWIQSWKTGSKSKKVILIICTILFFPILSLGYLLLWPLWEYYNPATQLSWKNPCDSLLILVQSLCIGIGAMVLFAPIIVFMICCFLIFLPFMIPMLIFSPEETVLSNNSKNKSRWAFGSVNDFNYTTKSRPDGTAEELPNQIIAPVVIELPDIEKIEINQGDVLQRNLSITIHQAQLDVE